MFNNNQGGVNVDTLNLPVFVEGTTTAEGAPGFETFTATLANTANAFINPAQATGTSYIIDSNLLNLSVANTSVMETAVGATMNFKVYLNGISGANVQFNWTLKDGTAKASFDYAGATSGTATVPAGSLFTTISVPIVPEAFFKGNRSFTLNITTPVGGGIQKASGTGTIMESQLTPTLTLSDAIVPKLASGQQQETFTVFANYPVASAASPGGLPTTMTITPSDFTAIAGNGDYINTPFTVTLPAGAVSTTFTIPINGNTNAEGNVIFRATLSNPSNGDLVAPRIADQDQGAPGEGIATIVDFHSVTAINIGDLVVVEGFNGQKTVNIPIILSTASAVPITVQVNTSDGTATANKNYVPINGVTFTIPALTKTFNIPVTILGNSVFVGNQTFFVTLSNAVNATVNKDKATVTIVDPNSVLGATQFLVNIAPAKPRSGPIAIPCSRWCPTGFACRSSRARPP